MSLSLTGASTSLKALGTRSTAPFSMVGVTWNGAHAKLRGTVEVRTIPPPTVTGRRG
ncbi:hypothetical protein ACWEO4_46120 [Streptomyces sp. NPDC004393]